jgi:hypothetical protein
MSKNFTAILRILTWSLWVVMAIGTAAAQQVPTLAAPRWSEGDWWVVDCQLYHTGKVVAGPAEPGWTPRQSWKFRVDFIESIDDQPHYVVSVRPQAGNTCPYWFRYWFRASDRRVSRMAMHHPEPSDKKARSIGPPVVVTNHSAAEPSPFVSIDFPALPLTVPLFGLTSGSGASAPAQGDSDVVQRVEEAGRSAVVRNADPSLKSFLETSSRENSQLIKIISVAGSEERQYWLADLPWCSYGERIGPQQMQRRYWLVDMGKE